MTRRALKKRFARRAFGAMDIYTHRALECAIGRKIRVLVDGQDVTRRCQGANDVHGSARVLKTRGGRFYRAEEDFWPDNVASEVLHGEVKFVIRRRYFLDTRYH